MSAGQSVEVTLPRSEVQLTAFVFPESPQGTNTDFKIKYVDFLKKDYTVPHNYRYPNLFDMLVRC